MASRNAGHGGVTVIAAFAWALGCGGGGGGPTSPGAKRDAGGEGIATSDDGGGDDGAASSADAQNGQAGASDAAMVQVICDTSSKDQLCTIRQVRPGDVMASQNQCAQLGGMVVTACPTAKLVGCCLETDLEQCQYSPTYDPMSAPTGCMRILGAWSTSQ